MFGLSLPKILVLVLIVGAVWYGYKWLARTGEDDPEKLREDNSRSGAGEDLVQCALCGTYAPARVDRCPEGRADCPLVQG
ncbi:MAG: hypothetical protein R3229_13185 [Alphaproteobacteria bacterium]|nr:hypothetical protein [Alphaproteobacteria bacterium]